MAISEECEGLAGKFIEPMELANWLRTWLERKRYRVVRTDARAIAEMVDDMKEEGILSHEEVRPIKTWCAEIEDAIQREDWSGAENSIGPLYPRLLTLMLNRVVECECPKMQ